METPRYLWMVFPATSKDSINGCPQWILAKESRHHQSSRNFSQCSTAQFGGFQLSHAGASHFVIIHLSNDGMRSVKTCKNQPAMRGTPMETPETGRSTSGSSTKLGTLWRHHAGGQRFAQHWTIWKKMEGMHLLPYSGSMEVCRRPLEQLGKIIRRLFTRTCFNALSSWALWWKYQSANSED